MTAPTVREAVAFGQSTDAQRMAWSRRHYAYATEVREDYGQDAAARVLALTSRDHSVAFAYAMGWVDALKVSAPEGRFTFFDQASALAVAFAEEWTHDQWLFRTERVGMASGYGNAWEEVVRLHGLDWRK